MAGAEGTVAAVAALGPPSRARAREKSSFTLFPDEELAAERARAADRDVDTTGGRRARKASRRQCLRCSEGEGSEPPCSTGEKATSCCNSSLDHLATRAPISSLLSLTLTVSLEPSSTPSRSLVRRVCMEKLWWSDTTSICAPPSISAAERDERILG